MVLLGPYDHPHDLALALRTARDTKWDQMGPIAFSKTAPVQRRGGY